MNLIIFLAIYLIGVIISSIIFARFIFRYNDPKDCFGLIKPDVDSEEEHYSCVAIISWIYPLTWIGIIIYLICIASFNFVKYISKL